MLSEIGPFLLVFALFVNLYAVWAIWYGIKRNSSTWEKSGQRAITSASALLFFALLFLLFAFVTDQFQIDYVAQHSSQEMPFYLKISAVWAGQEGSLLLWAFLQVLFATIESRRSKEGGSLLSRWATVFLGIIAAFFTAMTLLFSNPFITSGSTPLNGQGMNPLLRHPGMVFHPPILYLGYVGLAVPFAYALASLMTGQVETWIKDVQHWLLISWLALGVGIILGSRWAYDVLGWGGYWGWDAVENAGLMPWLTSTAMLHGFSQQRRGKGFKIWNISLAALTFGLVLFGTFTTRSGLIQSVHAFTHSQLGPYFLVMIGLTIIGTPLLMVSRKKTLGTVSLPERVFSREGTTLLSLILLVLITLSILTGTLLPTLTNGRFAASTSWFNRVVGPQLGLLVLLMGICPLLGRFGRAIQRKKWLIVFPVLGLFILPSIVFMNGFTKLVSLIGFAIAGFAGGSVIGDISFYLFHGKSTDGKKKLISDILRLGQRGFGGLLVHFGIVLIAIGVIGTQFYASEETITLSPGEFAEVGDYKLLYEDLFQETKQDQINTWAAISVYSGSEFKTASKPQITYFSTYDQIMAQPAIFSRLSEDLYIVFFQWDETNAASFNIMINPLSSFLWIGGLILIIGGLLSWGTALSPKNRQVSKRQKWFRRIAALSGITIMIILSVTLWGNPFESLRQTGRPLPGQQAPNFRAQDINGEDFSLEDYQGKVVVLHFWASWCPQCEDELVMIENTRSETINEDVVFVAVAMKDEQDTASEIASELELDYLIIPDPRGDISESFGVTAVPETFIINPEGIISSFYIGVMDELILATELESFK